MTSSLLCPWLCPTPPTQSRRNYHHLPITSASLAVDPGAHYASFPHFVSFAEKIKFAGGVNKPKIVTVTDSQGAQYRQLVRGRAGGRMGGWAAWGDGRS